MLKELRVCDSCDKVTEYKCIICKNDLCDYCENKWEFKSKNVRGAIVRLPCCMTCYNILHPIKTTTPQKIIDKLLIELRKQIVVEKL